MKAVNLLPGKIYIWTYMHNFVSNFISNFRISMGSWSLSVVPRVKVPTPVCTPTVHSLHSGYQDLLKTNRHNMTCSLGPFQWLPVTCRRKSELYYGLLKFCSDFWPLPASSVSSSHSPWSLYFGYCSLFVPWTCQTHSCILNLLFSLTAADSYTAQSFTYQI